MSPRLGKPSNMSGETFGVIPQDAEYLAPWQWDLILSADISPLSDSPAYPTNLQNAPATQGAWPLDIPPLKAALTGSPPVATVSVPELTLSPSLLSTENQSVAPAWQTPSCPAKVDTLVPPRHRTRERRAFTEAEDQALKRGYEKHGSQWCLIAKDPAFKNQRSSTDVRDRFRNAFPDEYARAGYKPRIKGIRRASDKQKDSFSTHHTRPTRSESLARRHKTRSVEHKLTPLASSGPLVDVAKPCIASVMQMAPTSLKGLMGASSDMPALPSDEPSQSVSQIVGPLAVDPTSPTESPPALTISPLSPPKQNTNGAMSWPVPTSVISSPYGIAPHAASCAWTTPEASKPSPFLNRAQTVPLSTPMSEPRTPLELPFSRSTADFFLYPNGGLDQVLSASPSSMEDSMSSHE
ncbi:Uncharacterized protein MSYG_0571 [Malassezia sympodialis ATCC 42132]|uniref:Uncharacterized protein n=2 Tax=Malassezia sympodialis (strain ATCC 42132) TaxID=1230383 RepID=A0A1M8A196_MALS4|nr:Uncharacterized protein MSYG_0571 [Malassezia sympodialis ATCC 42132]